jgi:DNA-binding NarL/FixJ family response regulator
MTSDLAYPWSVYQDLQQQISKFAQLDDVHWGLEEGLNGVLDKLQSGTLPGDPDDFQRDIRKIVTSAAWKDRSRARLRKKYGPTAAPAITTIESQLIARSEIEALRKRMGAIEVAILLAVAAGFSYHHIAKQLNRKAGAVRTRISRLRATARA